MRKKTYQQPTMKVVKVEQMGIICTSKSTPKQSRKNESYEEEKESVTSGWYN